MKSSDNWLCERPGMKQAGAHDDITFVDVINKSLVLLSQLQ